MTSSAYPSRFGSGPLDRGRPRSFLDTIPRGVCWATAGIVSGLLWSATIWAIVRLL